MNVLVTKLWKLCRRSCCTRIHCKDLILCIILLCFWSACSLPVVFFLSQNDSLNDLQVEEVENNELNSTCSEVIHSNGSECICLGILEKPLLDANCSHNNERNETFFKNVSHGAEFLLDTLNNINSSNECKCEITCLLCLHLLFSNCTIDLLTTSHCEYIQDSRCAVEWTAAVEVGINLPTHCDMISPDRITFQNNMNDNEGTKTSTNEAQHKGILDCSEGFYRKNTSDICRPNCYTWSMQSKRESLVIDVVMVIFCSVGLLMAMIAIIRACIKAKQLLKFPSIFLLYTNLNFAVGVVLVLISIISGRHLHCTSIDLLDSLHQVTSYCIAADAFFIYTNLQMVLWWLFHILVLFWSVFFPLHYHKQKTAGKMKHIHGTFVVLALFLPLILVILITVQLRRGKLKLMSSAVLWTRQTQFPAFWNTLCVTGSRSGLDYYYGWPIYCVIILGFTLLILVLYIFITQNIMKAKHQELSQAFKFRTVEKKLLGILCYYFLFVIISQVLFQMRMRKYYNLVEEIQNYFKCEENGHVPGELCSHSKFEDQSLSVVVVLLNSLGILYPFILIVTFMVNKEDLKIAKRISNLF